MKILPFPVRTRHRRCCVRIALLLGGRRPRSRSLARVPELPEVERARALVESKALGREIVGVDDSDTYVSRPHSPGQIADALVGRSLVAGAPARQVDVVRDLGRRAGAVPAPRHGGADRDRRGAGAERALGPLHARVRRRRRLALRDRRRLGRVRSSIRTSSQRRARRRRGLARGASASASGAGGAAEGAADGPVRDRGRRQPAGRRDRCGRRARTRDGRRRLWATRSSTRLRRATARGRSATRSAAGGAHTGKLIPHRVRGGRCPRCGTAAVRATGSAAARRTGARWTRSRPSGRAAAGSAPSSRAACRRGSGGAGRATCSR